MPRKIEWEACPQSLRGGFQRYIEDGILPGSFLRAVLRNDFMSAVFQADDENVLRLREICLFVHNEIPNGCWGSPERVEAWVEQLEEARHGRSHDISLAEDRIR